MRPLPWLSLLLLSFPLALHAESWVLEEPTVFDLRMPDSFFDEVPLELADVHFDSGFSSRTPPEELERLKGALARSRPRTCHTQGLAFSEEHVFVSCSFYADTLKRIRAYAARSLLLRAPRRALLEGSGAVPWELFDLTARHEDARFQPPVTRVLGHPSGLVFDPRQQGLWIATAVYDPDTYSFLHLLRWDRAGAPVPLAPPLPVEDHIGTLDLFLAGDLVMGIDWDSRVYLLERKTGRARWVEGGFEVAYQDCDVWSDRAIVCGGYREERVQEAGLEWEVQSGRLDLLVLEGESWDRYRVAVSAGLPARGVNGDPAPRLELGRLKVRYEEGRGDIETRVNQYGDYRTPLTLTHNGMALSPDRRYVYFLPADLQQARLVRFTLAAGR